MKCVKNLKTNTITRVSNEVANVFVHKNHTHIFVSKTEWKEAGRK